MMIRRFVINICLPVVFITAMTAVTLPFSAQIKFNAGRKFLINSQWEQAQEAYERAVRMMPLSSDYWIGYGEYLWYRAIEEDDVGLWKQVEPAYIQAAKMNPQCAECWIKIGQAQHADERVEEAVVSFKKAQEVDPQGQDTAFWLEEYRIEK
jgi:tetratricopeptide (TPR) repeat protein